MMLGCQFQVAVSADMQWVTDVCTSQQAVNILFVNMLFNLHQLGVFRWSLQNVCVENFL